jgi:hypothetical protein
MSEQKTAFPLTWPEGRPRTAPGARRRAVFKTSFAQARSKLIRELNLLGAKDSVFSSNIRRRLDGLPYADSLPVNGDPGIAAYFTRKGKQLCFACDCWTTVDANMHAIALTVEALRGIARWGTGDMMEAAFRGFAALPERSGGDWWRTLGVSVNASFEQAKEAYRILVKKHHPDAGGDGELFRRVQEAWEACQKVQQETAA